MRKLNLAKKAALSLFICSATSCNSYVVPEYSTLKKDSYINVNAKALKKNEGATIKVRVNFPKKGYSLKNSADVVPEDAAKTSADIKSYAVYLVKSTDEADPESFAGQAVPDPLDPLSGTVLGPYYIDKTEGDVNSLTIINVPDSGYDGEDPYYYYVAVRAYNGPLVEGVPTGVEIIKPGNGPENTGTAWTGTTLATAPNLALSNGDGIQIDDELQVDPQQDITLTINLLDGIGAWVDGKITLTPLLPQRVMSYNVSLATDPTQPVTSRVAGPVTINRDIEDLSGFPELDIENLIHQMIVKNIPNNSTTYSVTVEAFDEVDGGGNSLILPDNGDTAYTGDDAGEKIAVSTNTVTVTGGAIELSDSVEDRTLDFIKVFPDLGITSEVIAGSSNTTCGDTSSCGDGGEATLTSVRIDNPGGIAVDSNGNIYIADDDRHKIRKLTPDDPSDRNTTYTISTVAGTGDDDNVIGATATQSDLDGPMGVAVDSNGVLYISDTNNDRLLKVVDGVLSLVTNDLNSPEGIAVDSDGNVYIADTGNNQIKKFSNGILDTILSSGLDNPVAVSVGNDGFVYIADNGSSSIKRIGTSGSILSNLTPTGLGFNPNGIVVDTQLGIIYISDDSSDTIKRMSTSGGELTEVTTTASTTFAEFDAPHSLALDGSGHLFVSNTGNDRILRLY